MKGMLSVLATAVIAVGLSAMTGCESMHHDADNTSSSIHAQTSGGNGEFCESPAKPGQYNTDNSSGG